MNSSYKLLNVSRIDGSILHIILNRPDALNALSAELLSELNDVFINAKEDASIKALLLSGEGKAFCAGADIKQLATLNAHAGSEFARHGQKIFRTLEQLGKPSLAAIHGFALGGGCELSMSATIRIAAATAAFGQPEVKLGVIPGFGGTQRLARLVGKGRALDLCLTGRLIKAEEALAWGLITEVVAPDELLNRAKQILAGIAKLPPLALQSIMTVIDHGNDLTLTDAFELEAAHFGLCCATVDKKEGVQAFLEKRTAEFCGE
jgi:enoyl-CoA hydratase